MWYRFEIPYPTVASDRRRELPGRARIMGAPEPPYTAVKRVLSPRRGEAPAPIAGAGAPEVRWGFARTMIVARATGNGWMQVLGASRHRWCRPDDTTEVLQSIAGGRTN
jgi:hypothetical protein